MSGGLEDDICEREVEFVGEGALSDDTGLAALVIHLVLIVTRLEELEPELPIAELGLPESSKLVRIGLVEVDVEEGRDPVFGTLNEEDWEEKPDWSGREPVADIREVGYSVPVPLLDSGPDVGALAVED